MPTRRTFLRTGAATAAALAAPRWARAAARPRGPRRSALAEALASGDPATLDALRPFAPRLRGAQSTPQALTSRFTDLARHFVFEYYPWYQADPWQHWDQWDRRPPDDLAANYVPRLGAYDSRSRAVIEQHARWIVSTGAGAVNLSWWGPGSPEDRVVPTIMDVMKDYGLKVAFHLEPYRDDHGYHMAEDILYLLRRYGDARSWDTFLLLRHADGRVGPVFKGFRTILPPRSTDCHGVTNDIADYTPDDVFARQLESLRRDLRGEFDRVTLLADSVDFIRAPRAGFDGIAIYDNFIAPGTYEALAGRATEAGLVFSFNVNPGYDTIEPRTLPPDSCHVALPFVPTAAALDWTAPAERERAALLSTARIAESLERTVTLQTDPALVDYGVGFLLVYINSFNEWHEGHAFEPMKDAAALSSEERRNGYHNPARGDYRLTSLTNGLAPILGRKTGTSV